jgi:hypothetical protein
LFHYTIMDSRLSVAIFLCLFRMTIHFSAGWM